MKKSLAFNVLFTAVILFAAGSISEAVLLDRVVAIVNQEVITWSELYRDMDSEASPQLRDLKDEEKRKIYKENEATFLEGLVNAKLQLQEAKSLGMSAGDEEVKEAEESIKKKYEMSDRAFEESLKKEGYTHDEYQKRLREQILIGKLVNQQVRSKVIVTDEEVNKTMQQSAAVPEGYSISQIFFARPGKDEDKKKVEERAAAVMERLKAGEDFAELAKSYSEDASAADGGNLGFLKKDAIAKEFAEAVSGLKPGAVSAPFWTERGLHIIKLDGKEENKTPGEVRRAAEKSVSDRLFAAKYKSWVKSLREKSFIDIKL